MILEPGDRIVTVDPITPSDEDVSGIIAAAEYVGRSDFMLLIYDGLGEWEGRAAVRITPRYVSLISIDVVEMDCSYPVIPGEVARAFAERVRESRDRFNAEPVASEEARLIEEVRAMIPRLPDEAIDRLRMNLHIRAIDDDELRQGLALESARAIRAGGHGSPYLRRINLAAALEANEDIIRRVRGRA